MESNLLPYGIAQPGDRESLYTGHRPTRFTRGSLKMRCSAKLLRHPQGADQKDDLIYHKDSANGTVLACLAEKPSHSLFNIATGVGVTLMDFARAVKGFYPEAEVEIGPGLDFLMKNHNTYSVFDISRARTELGYYPQYDVEKGVADYVEMMKLLKIEPTYTPDKRA